MRIALVFPPQWDPRQPPLAPAILAGVLQKAGVQTRVFDLNISLYRHLISSKKSNGIKEFLLNRLLDPNSLSNAESYIKTSEMVQRIFDEQLDPRGNGRIFWDACGGLPNINESSQWKNIIETPEKIPFVKHLHKEISDIRKWAPEVIGISVISDSQLPAAISLAAILRKAIPDSRILLGGNAITYRRSLLPVLDWLKTTIDDICVGDGEALMKVLAKNTRSSELPNTINWKRDGQAHFGKSNLHDLKSSITPDFSSLPLKEYLTPHLVVPVETARGCPWGQCAFCIHPVKAQTGRPAFRLKPVSLVQQEINSLFASGHRRFLIVDEAITPPRLRELTEIFTSLPEPVSWIGYIRIDENHTRENLVKAREAGCLKLFLGVESGSDTILSRFNKGTTQASSRKVLLDIANAGIATHLFLMTGFPGETETDRQSTLNLLKEVLPSCDPFGFSFDLFNLTGELETDLTLTPQKYGWNGPLKNPQNDLAWQFPIMSGHAAAESLLDFKTQIHNLADEILGKAFGLRHASLAQDSLHLLLLEAHN